MPIKYEALSYIYNQDTPFATAALHDINLTILDGGFTAVIGETGSGKSTLVQHLNALLIPSQGKIMVNDFCVEANRKNHDLKKLRQKVGLVFQFPEYQLFEETILQDVSFGPKNFGADEETAIKAAKYSLNLVGLDESYYDRNPFELSGGQKRRVAIAGILAMDPDILVLDEPTAGLDPQGAKEMNELFVMLNQKHHKTIIMVTHNMDHVLSYCQDVIVLNHGKVFAHESVNEFFRDDAALSQLNVALPQVIELRNMLIARGLDIDPGIIKSEELVKAITRAVQHG